MGFSKDQFERGVNYCGILAANTRLADPFPVGIKGIMFSFVYILSEFFTELNRIPKNLDTLFVNFMMIK